MFKVHMLPAEYGDCLWIEYGSKSTVHRMLVDAGTGKTWPALRRQIEALPKSKRVFDLLVVTHIDLDHIGGILKLLDDADDLGVKFHDVWFNGYSHVEQATDQLGALEGEKLSARLTERGDSWNAAFKGKPIVVSKRKALPRATIGGMKITIVSPGTEQMQRLLPVWKETIENAGLVPGVESRRDPKEISDLLGGIDIDQLSESRFSPDTKEPNGSSIAFVMQYGGKGVLFGADAFPEVLLQNVKRMPKDERNAISVFKLPHHGSRKNLSNDLLEALSCRTFLVSTNGRRYSHPNRESIARAIHRGRGAKLKFNYRTACNSDWDDDELMHDFKYSVEYGDRDGLVVDCMKT